MAMVSLESVEPDSDDSAMLHSNIEEHVEATGSVIGNEILCNWDDTTLGMFVKVFPHDLRRVMEEERMRQAEIVEDAAA